MADKCRSGLCFGGAAGRGVAPYVGANISGVAGAGTAAFEAVSVRELQSIDHALCGPTLALVMPRKPEPGRAYQGRHQGRGRGACSLSSWCCRSRARASAASRMARSVLAVPVALAASSWAAAS